MLLFSIHLVTLTAIYSLVVLGLQISVGPGRVFLVAPTVFFCIGAYTSAILTVTYGWTLGAALILAVALAGLSGLIFGRLSSRLSGDHLILASLGLCEIARSVLNNWFDLTNGSIGIMGIPSFPWVDSPLSHRISCLMLSCAVLLLGIGFALFLRRSRFGVMHASLDIDEPGTTALGRPVSRTKRVGIACGAVWMALGGFLYAHYVGYIDPTTFSVGEAITILAMLVIGGLYHPSGALLGAAFLTILPELLRFAGLPSHVADPLRRALCGILLIVIIRLRPEGLCGSFTRRKSVKNRTAKEQPVPEYFSIPSLIVDRIEKHFGGVTALDGVSFAMEPASILGLVGGNGAGKTTLIEVITGRLKADRGCIFWGKQQISGFRPEHIGVLGIVRTFQEARVPDHVTVQEYLSLACSLGPFERILPNLLCRRAARRCVEAVRRRVLAQLDCFGFVELADRECGELSMGDKKFLTLLRAFLAQPKILFLDEPTAGLSKPVIEHLKQLIRQARGQGTSICVVSHDREFTAAIADRILWLEQGKAQSCQVQEYKDRLARCENLSSWGEKGDGITYRPRQHTRSGSNSDALLRVDHLHVTLGQAYILQDVNFSIGKGEAVGITGPNGAGKSALLRALAGLQPRRKGSIIFRGTDLDGLAAHEIAQSGLGVVLQGVRVPLRLSVEEAVRMAWTSTKSCLRVNVNSDGIWSDLRCCEALLERFPALGRRRSVQCGLLSGGEQQMVACAMALALRPRFLALDEPSTGLHDDALRGLFEWFGDLVNRGLSLLIVEQDTKLLLRIAQRGIELSQGRVLNTWSTEERPHVFCSSQN